MSYEIDLCKQMLSYASLIKDKNASQISNALEFFFTQDQLFEAKLALSKDQQWIKKFGCPSMQVPCLQFSLGNCDANEKCIK